ncbi:cytidine deaminase [Roseivirga sp. E12]|uniref:cytidine deaminase family protein n=1 Tax=Roseivirga sp. E12 TaxID=2819237 RepID=UPI001ABC4641|nr:hypothetical protein [Roseivirga sp. E12]MBO3700194.1 hypothetical protein [Roseivirga sp. E12]
MSIKLDWDSLFQRAWEARENASILGNTKVGSALITKQGNIFGGCNIEQTYRNKDIHAEVNAISTMVGAGEKEFLAIAIVAQREFFTPCGTCLDWIFQFGGPDTIVGIQNSIQGETKFYKASELMPHYPY